MNPVAREIVYIKFGPDVQIGGVTLDYWSNLAGRTSDIISKITVREDEHGNIWAKWSGGSPETRDHEDKIPVQNIRKVTYRPVAEKPQQAAQPGKGK